MRRHVSGARSWIINKHRRSERRLAAMPGGFSRFDLKLTVDHAVVFNRTEHDLGIVSILVLSVTVSENLNMSSRANIP